MNIDSKATADEMFNKLFSMQMKNSYVFRGISEEAQYNPSLIRNYVDLAIALDIRDYEMKLLKDYALYTKQYIPYYSHPLDFVASAQHYGIPTRLIDWTYNPFVALFFSLYKSDNADAKYEIVIADPEKNIMFDYLPIFEDSIPSYNTPGDELLQNYKRIIDIIDMAIFSFSDKRHNLHGLQNDLSTKIQEALQVEEEVGEHKLFFCSSNESNSRIIAQNGLFQIPRRFQKEVDRYCIMDDIKNSCYDIITIDHSQRGYILEILKKIGVISPRLFPDLEGICSYIRYKKDW